MTGLTTTTASASFLCLIPQNPQVGPPQDLRNSIYNNSGLIAKINSCINSLLEKVYGKEWKKAHDYLGDQNLANAPRIDARLTSEQLSKKFTGGLSTYATGVAGRGYGPYGTVFVGSQWFANPIDWTVNGRNQEGRSPLQNSYIHELANIISQRLTGGQTARLFGVPGAEDDDSGYALQACVFNEEIRMKKK